MKCTQCGSSALSKTTLPFDVNGDATLSSNKALAVYLCLDCGHYEFFSTENLEKYKKAYAEIQTVADEIQVLIAKAENSGNTTLVKELKALQVRVENLSAFNLNRNELFDVKATILKIK
jgi:hypothetical protein